MAQGRSNRRQMRSVVDELGAAIARGDYRPGDTLPIEQELAQRLDVGRNALREAIKWLSGKGLINSSPRSGTRIRPREEWNMLDPDILRWHASPDAASEPFLVQLIELRLLIEPRSAALAAERASKSELAPILDAVDRMAAAKSDLSARVEADIAFHTAILRASGNELMSHFRFAVETYLRAHASRAQALDPSEMDEDLARHQAIAWAIAAGKSAQAESLSRELLGANLRHVRDR